MDQEFLVDEQITAGIEFLREFDKSYPVSSACWLRPVDSDHSVLYVASDAIDDKNVGIAYGEVARCLREFRSPWLDVFRVKLVSSSSPVAQEAKEIRDTYPAPILTRYSGTSLGGMGIDSAIIYAPFSKSTP